MEIASRSGAMCSPDFPTAMTMRPQFASSPAIAVLTSGELATASAVRRAAGSSTAPRTSMVTNFEMPSPSFTTCCARSSITLSSAARNDRTRGSAASVIGEWPAAPVANTSVVSLVEVSESTVMAVEGSLGGGCEQRLKGRWRDNGVGEHEGQHRRHIRSTSASLLDDTGYVNGNVVDDADAALPFENVSVVAIVRAACSQSACPRSSTAPGRAATSLSVGRNSPMTPVDATNTLSAGQPNKPPTAAAVSAEACSPAGPVKALALPALTISALLAARQHLATPQYRRGCRSRSREHAGHAGRFRQLRQQQVGPPSIANLASATASRTLR